MMANKKLDFELKDVFFDKLIGYDTTHQDINTLATRFGILAIKLQQVCNAIDGLQELTYSFHKEQYEGISNCVTKTLSLEEEIKELKNENKRLLEYVASASNCFFYPPGDKS